MTKSATTIAILYSLFAGLSTVVNIASQMISIWIYSGRYAVEVSIIVGTIAGLPLRYFLEKKYIFAFQSKGIKHDGILFVMYSFMGIFTTLIFWGVEYGFHLLFSSDTMRYLGAIIGLSIGYFIKYQLDKRYVFINKEVRGIS